MEVRGDPGAGRLRQGAFAVEVMATCGLGRSFPQKIDCHGGVRDDLIDLQRPGDLEDGLEIFLAFVGYHERLVAGRFRHQPDAHFRDHAKIRLGKHAVELRTGGVLGHLPVFRSRECSLAGPYHFAVGQHHFHAALHDEMVAIRSVACAMFQRIAHHAAPCWRCGIDPELAADRAQMPVKLHVRNTGLDEGIAVFLVDFDNPVHPAQVEHDITGLARSRATIGKIAPRTDCPDGYFIGVGDLEYILNLFDVVRSNGR